jgi:hypothetical protein
LKFLGAVLTGAGHGSGLFYIMGESPLGIGPVIWPIIGALIPYLRKPWISSVVILALISHYYGIANWWFSGDHYPMYVLKRTIVSGTALVGVTTLIYVLGQAFLWRKVVKSISSNK